MQLSSLDDVVLTMHPSTRQVWREAIPGAARAGVRVLEIVTPDGAWHRDGPPSERAWGPVIRSLEEQVRAVKSLGVRRVHVVARAALSLGALLGSRLEVHGPDLAVYQRTEGRGWTSWGPVRPEPVEPEADAVLGIPAELAGDREHPGADVVVGVGVTRPVRGGVQQALPGLGLASAPRLWVELGTTGQHALDTPSRQERAARDVAPLLEALAQTFPGGTVHFFYSGPLALVVRGFCRAHLLGCSIVFYEWVQVGENQEYRPAIRFPAGTLVTPADSASSTDTGAGAGAEKRPGGLPAAARPTDEPRQQTHEERPVITPRPESPPSSWDLEHLSLVRTMANRLGRDGARPLEGLVGLMVPHFLEDLRGVLRAFWLLGLAPRDTYLWYKRYQYRGKQKLIEEVRDLGYHVDELERLSDTLGSVVDEARARGKRVVVFEDGGYVVPALHRMGAARTDHVVGAVEQTAHGVWNVQRAIDESGPLRFPLLPVADSKLKDEVEPPHVGRAIVRNVRALQPERDLSGKTCLVVGFGRIGEAVAEAARDAEQMLVKVYDRDLLKMGRAKTRGYATVDPLVEGVREAHLVIGTTGQKVIGQQEVAALRHGAVVVSGSSGQYEIGLDELRDLSREQEAVPEGTWFTLSGDHRRVLLLADGYPVNFHNTESVPMEAIDAVLAALVTATVEVTRRSIEPGIRKDKIDGILDAAGLVSLYYDIYVNRR